MLHNVFESHSQSDAIGQSHSQSDPMTLIASLNKALKHKSALNDGDELDQVITKLTAIINRIHEVQEDATKIRKVSVLLTLASHTTKYTDKEWAAKVIYEYNKVGLSFHKLTKEQLEFMQSIGQKLIEEAKQYQNNTTQKQEDWDETVAKLYKQAGWPSPITNKRPSLIIQLRNDLDVRRRNEYDFLYEMKRGTPLTQEDHANLFVEIYATAGLPPPAQYPFSLPAWIEALSPR